MNGMIVTLLKNKHTSGAGLAYAVFKVAPKIAHVWWPSHEAQIQSTVDLLEPIAILYGLGMAGDANRSATKEDVKTVADAVVTGDTSHITKAQTETKP